jgi:hypothetical protein
VCGGGGGRKHAPYDSMCMLCVVLEVWVTHMTPSTPLSDRRDVPTSSSPISDVQSELKRRCASMRAGWKRSIFVQLCCFVNKLFVGIN